MSSPLKPLYVAAPNDFGGNFVILFDRDDGRAFAVSPEDSLMIELEERPSEGLRWHVVEAPPGFIVHYDEWIQDGSFTKKGTRRVKNQHDPLTRRVIMHVDYGAEPGDIVLVLGPSDVEHDEYGFAIVPEDQVAGQWSVQIDDTETPAREQAGLPGRRRGESPLYEVPLTSGPRQRLSALAERLI